MPFATELRPQYDSDPYIRAIRAGIDAQVYALDRELRYVTFNQRHAEWVQKTCRGQAVVGGAILDLITDLSARGELYSDLQRALGGEHHRNLRTCHVGGGATVRFDAHFIPVRDDLERIIGVAVVMNDRTEPTIREQALQSLERRYQALLQAASDGILVVRSDGTVVETNEAYAALVGAPVAEVMGSKSWRWSHDGDPARSLKSLGTSFDHERRFETVLRRADGTLLAVEIASAPVQMDGLPAALFQVRDITERVLAARKIAAQEAQLRLIFEHAPIGLGVADLSSGRLVEANHALLEMYGRDLAVATASPLNSFTHPEDRAQESRPFQEMAAGLRSAYSLRKRYVQPDGTEVPAEVRAVRLPDVLGRPPMVLGIITDLRELAEAERVLRESKERYKRLAENAEDLIYRIGGRGSRAIEYINPAVTRILGFTPEECYADPSLPFARVHTEDHPRLMGVLAGTADMATPHVIRWAAADGSWRWLEHRSRVVRDEAGAVIAVEGIARDVTERMKSDEQLRLFGRVVDQAAEGVIITDRAGHILHVNETFKKVTGYSREEVLGRDPRLLKSGHQDERFYRRMWRELGAGRAFSATVKNRRKDGTIYDAEINVSPVRDPSGAVTHFVGLQRDVTEELVRAEQLRQAQKMESMGQLTGGVAHDFNNLLTIILATADLIAPSLEPESDAASFLRDLIDSAKHGSTLVRQLLAFGRQGVLTPGPLDLESTGREFLDVLRRLLPESIGLKGVTGTAPAVFADRGAVEQILVNLATNARDAMPEGGSLTLSLGTRAVPEGFGELDAETTFVTLTVRDTGCGMDATTRAKAMEPFFTTKAPGKGTGLGLPMVFGVMKQLGGWVELESEPGRGTAVILGFPLAPADAIHESAPAVAKPNTAAPAAGSRVLVVEDNPAVRRVATRSLESLGYTVVTAPDGEAGWSTWCSLRSSIDLILTDAVMPNLSGTDLVRRIREKGGKAPIILASGYTPDDFEDITSEVTLLSKPWTLESLQSSVTGALAHAAA